MSDDTGAALALAIVYFAAAYVVVIVLLVVGIAYVVFWLLRLLYRIGRRLIFGPPLKRERRRVRREYRSAIRDISAIRRRAERRMARAARTRRSKQLARW